MTKQKNQQCVIVIKKEKNNFSFFLPNGQKSPFMIYYIKSRRDKLKIKELTNEEFMVFQKSFPVSSPYQTSEYAMTMTKQEYDSFYLGMYDDNNILIAASLIIVELLGKFRYAYAPRGFLIDYNNEYHVKEFTKLVKIYLRNKNIIAVKISPLIVKSTYTRKYGIITDPNFENIYNLLKDLDYYHLGYNNYFEAIKPRYEAIIDLNPNTSLMFSSISKNYRTKIRASDRIGIRIYKGDENYLPLLYKLTKKKYPRNLEYLKSLYNYYKNRNMIDLYFALLDTKRYLINIQKEYQDQNIKCTKVTDDIFKNQGKASNSLIAKKIVEDNKLETLKRQLIQATQLLQQNPDGIIVASAITVKQQKEVYLILDGYDVNHKSINAKHLLIWKLIEKYAKDGYEKFNLGGISNPLLEKNKYKGLNDFKLGFGAKAIEYIGDLELITHPILYTLYRNSSPLRKLINGKK